MCDDRVAEIERNKWFWEYAEKKDAVRSHGRFGEDDTHYYCFIDTATMFKEFAKQDSNWQLDLFTPSYFTPHVLLSTNNPIAQELVKNVKERFFVNAISIQADTRELKKYEVVANDADQIVGQNILIVTDATNSGNSLLGLVNVCKRINERSSENPGKIKILIFIDRLIGDTREAIARMVDGEENLHFFFQIPIPTFSEKTKFCPLCAEKKQLSKHSKMNIEAGKYVAERLEKIRRKPTSLQKVTKGTRRNKKEKYDRCRSLDYFYSKGNDAILKAITTNIPLRKIYHILEIIPFDSKCFKEKREEIICWISEQLSDSKNVTHLTKLLRIALHICPEKIIERLDYVIIQFAIANRVRFFSYILEYLILENKAERHKLKNKLRKIQNRSPENNNFFNSLLIAITDNVPNIIKRRPSIFNIYEKIIAKAATTDVNILIVGETGTGKGRIAKLIHNQSNRHDNMFQHVVLNSIPDTLIESALFGYKKGAFTGADNDTVGLIESADKGTLFLDEIGDVTLPIQLKILRFIESKSITKVGETIPKKINCRLLFATNTLLEEKIIQEKFRNDLYYRMKVITIKAPALRENTDDIVQLSDFFFDRFCKKHSIQRITNQKKCLNIFVNYSWPGNIRELGNVIEEAVILSENGLVDLHSIENNFLNDNTRNSHDLFEHSNLRQARDEFDVLFISKALTKHRWDISKTANAIGYTRVGLNKRMKKLKIIRPK